MLAENPIFLVSTRPHFKWSANVKKMYEYKCAIQNKRVSRLHAHHLFSKKGFPALQFYPLNGIPIALKFHVDFHSQYGFTTTVDDFISYIETLEKTSSRDLSSVHLND